MKKNGPSKQRVKRYTIALTECEMRRLTAYADAADTDRPTALHRLVSRSLRDVTASMSLDGKVDENQLGLFDSVQLDIFNNTHKVQET